jgi:uncharacterized protein (DUF2132 family)
VTLDRRPLDGVTLKTIVTELVEHYGFAELANRVDIKCFRVNPSISSSLTFLRRTPWARTEVEELYLRHVRAQGRRARKAARAATTEDSVVPDGSKA